MTQEDPGAVASLPQSHLLEQIASSLCVPILVSSIQMSSCTEGLCFTPYVLHLV